MYPPTIIRPATGGCVELFFFYFETYLQARAAVERGKLSEEVPVKVEEAGVRSARRRSCMIRAPALFFGMVPVPAFGLCFTSNIL